MSNAVSILAEGRNCWCVAPARRAALLTNAVYFRHLAQMLQQARHRVLLIGWDLDAGLVLDREATGPAALPLAAFLTSLLQDRPALQIRFLLWDRTIFYGGNRLSADALGALDAAHVGFRHHYTAAPPLCSHHAKVVVIDDDLAFVGGIDLAGDRWDRRDHPPSHPARVTPAGEAYGPVHDLQMLVEGPIAAALGAYAVRRWTEATGEPAPSAGPGGAEWPADLPVDLSGLTAGIARNVTEGAREIAALNRDALTAARACIYLEAQYLTAEIVGDALVRQLERPDGPEIVIVVTRTSHGVLEQFAMGHNRDRLLRRLKAADRWNRLRVYHPTAFDGTTRAEVKIHAKLVVIDDRLLRVGSSNLNNRSMAVDTECDIAFEARSPAERASLRALRDRLIADQLHEPTERVTEAFRQTGSLIAVIERLNRLGYLQPFEIGVDDGPRVPMPGSTLLDPQAPPSLGRLWCELGLWSAPDLGPGEQQAAERERDQEIDDPEHDQRPDRVHARQQRHDDRLEHAEPARHVADEGREIAQHIGHGDDAVVDGLGMRQHEIERRRDEAVVDEAEPDLLDRDRGGRHVKHPPAEAERPAQSGGEGQIERRYGKA